MSRNKSTKLLSIISALNLLITSILSIIIGRLILILLGSEYNGINSIIAQFITIISIIEGGLTTASIVALMKPYQQKNTNEINQIFAETKIKFKKITILLSTIGIISAIAYGYAINTNIPNTTVIAILLAGLLSTIFNIGIISKYRLVYQVAQEEHIFALVTLCSNIIGQAGMIIILLLTKNIILIRLYSTLITIIAGIIAIKIFHKRYQMINIVEWDGKNRIKGTKDVFVGKLVGTIHSSATAISLSIFSNAAITSVYMVYNSIIYVITSVVNIFFSAPQNAIGQILQENNDDKKKKIILEYEYIIIIILTVLFIPLSTLIVPFVKIYTQGVTDVQYINYLLAFLMVISTYFQLIHIPSGICIYMSGSFDTAKKIQLNALFVLLAGNIVLGNMFGMYGFLVSILLCNIFLAFSEIIYLHKKIIKNTIKNFILMWIPNILLTIISIVVVFPLSNMIHSIVSWILIACVITLFSLIITIVINMIFLKKNFIDLIQRIKNILRKA